MPKSSSTRATGLTYSIFTAAVLLLLLSIAEIVLEVKFLQAFRNLKIQYPGSSLAEWTFVSMNPQNLDTGPTSAIFTIMAGSLSCSMFALVWMVVGGEKSTSLGLWSCITTSASTIGALGFTVYVFVTETQNELPEYFSRWRHSTFTREFYICKVFPSVFVDAETYYGFPACTISQVAKYQLIGISVLCIILAVLSVVHLHRLRKLRRLRKRWDVESSWPTRGHTKRRHRRRKNAVSPTGKKQKSKYVPLGAPESAMIRKDRLA